MDILPDQFLNNVGNFKGKIQFPLSMHLSAPKGRKKELLCSKLQTIPVSVSQVILIRGRKKEHLLTAKLFLKRCNNIGLPFGDFAPTGLHILLLYQLKGHFASA